MSITDELREWLEDGFINGTGEHYHMEKVYQPWFGWRSVLEPILDRIDAEHEQAVYNARHDALYEANEHDMAELGWVRKDKEHVVSHASIEVTPHIDWSRMADELDEFAQTVRGMARGGTNEREG